MNLRHRNVLSRLFLNLIVRSKPLVPLPDMLLKVKLPIRREARHQFWLTQRQRMPPIRLPQVVHLSIQIHDLLHLVVLGYLPCAFGYSAVGHDEHSRLDLVRMRMPQFALFLVECFIELGCDHVLNPYEAGVGLVRVVEETLAYVLI